jgi:membrane fusion protein
MKHSTTLFRKEAIDGQKKHNFGEAMLLPKTNHQYLTAFLVCWFFGLLALLISANYSSKATVNGWLVSTKTSINIIAKEGSGIVGSSQVYNGQYVSKGQVLLEVTPNTPALSPSKLSKQVASLQTQIELIEQRKEIRQNKYSQQVQQNNSLLESYQKHLLINTDSIVKVDLQLKEALDQETAFSELMRNGSLSKTTYQTQKEKRQAIETHLAQLQLAKLELERNLLSTEQNKTSNKLILKESLNTLASTLQNLQQELVSLEASRMYVIKSPVDGIVHNLQATSGETIDMQLPLMQITPLNNPLKARLYIPSNHAGFIQEGQTVQLKLNAFPYQKFGMTNAKVSHVSKQILLPHQVKNLPVQLLEPVFIVDAELKEQHINTNGAELDLKAGMLFQANITLSQRSLWEWLLNPILSLRGQF